MKKIWDLKLQALQQVSWMITLKFAWRPALLNFILYSYSKAKSEQLHKPVNLEGYDVSFSSRDSIA